MLALNGCCRLWRRWHPPCPRAVGFHDGTARHESHGHDSNPTGDAALDLDAVAHLQHPSRNIDARDLERARLVIGRIGHFQR